MVNLVWFRNDLRLADNPALSHGAKLGPVIGLYILDESSAPENRPLGGASRWWLHHSLSRLKDALPGMIFLQGDPAVLIPQLARELQAGGVFWNRNYDPWSIKRDGALKERLKAEGLDARSYNGSLLFEPKEVQNKAGGPFKVFSAFWRACLRHDLAEAVSAPKLEKVTTQGQGVDLDALDLLPNNPDWASGFSVFWTPGEDGAQTVLDRFLSEGLNGYADLRDRMDLPNTSRLSAHLRFGEISVRDIWWRVQQHMAVHPQSARDGNKFLAEIGWREFSYHLLYHFPHLPTQNLNTAFDAFPWQDDAQDLKRWQRGMTGYPVVDAAMRELWQTGYMHNRARMIVASFLTKHLRIDWRRGENWFWDTLLDADAANNAASWQWAAGCGADAAPYFRIFNPILQGQKFDPDGTYVRQWCPELADLPNKHLHAPWQAPSEILKQAGVSLGDTYPQPIVDHKQARQAALDSYAHVKRS